MATKADIEEEINEKLDTRIEWSQLKKDDLELLNELIDEGHLLERMAKHVAKEKGKEKLDESVDEWTPGQILGKLV